jgi:hypothetical protein
MPVQTMQLVRVYTFGTILRIDVQQLAGENNRLNVLPKFFYSFLVYFHVFEVVQVLLQDAKVWHLETKLLAAFFLAL